MHSARVAGIGDDHDCRGEVLEVLIVDVADDQRMVAAELDLRQLHVPLLERVAVHQQPDALARGQAQAEQTIMRPGFFFRVSPCEPTPKIAPIRSGVGLLGDGYGAAFGLVALVFQIFRRPALHRSRTSRYDSWRFRRNLRCGQIFLQTLRSQSF